ncbi:GDSL esterase/lipase At5g33370 [Cryptomeria japonica]|uniref:GDSL esterase/lipase At5g33370 n=1 Tax=Cryptomeria japonica TaxID=3369 RepID=UPI0027DA0AB4|nr:GDSL esterase/lipase At5g33370 [Cryptomeria japonica]
MPTTSISVNHSTVRSEKKMSRLVGSLVGLLVILSCCFCDVKAATAYFVFGDSLVDNGNNNYVATTARADSYPYGIDYPTGRPTGRFSNGLNIADFISRKLGAESVLPYLSPALNGNALLRGANFASAGVGILNDTGVQFANIIRMPQQFQYFIQYKNRVAQTLGAAAADRLVAQGLMSITLGGNDYVNNYYLLPVSARSVQYTLPAYTQLIVSEYKKYLRRMYDLGGRRVLVTSTGPLGCAPGVKVSRSRNGECAVELQQAASLFNSQLKSVINQLNSEVSAQVFTFADSYSMNMGLFNNPTAYGFVNTTDACCGQGRYNGAGLCTAASNLCSNRDTYLFWDNYHLSQKANRIIVDEIFQGSSSVMSPLNLSQMMKLDN